MGSPAYEVIGQGYSRFRQPDPRIAAAIDRALGDAAAILNVGAGTGSYEPARRGVVAVEPSPTMIRQRPPGSAPVVQAAAEHLPLPDRSFDATLAILTVHHWADWRAGLRELRRVAPRCVVFTFDPAPHNRYWLLRDYLPGSATTPSVARAPAVADIAAELGTDRVEPVLVPHDCTDGFGWAYWRRPERYLEPGAAQAISTLAQLPDDELRQGLGRLADDLASGRWHDRYGHLLDLDAIDGGFRLIVA